MLKTSFSKELYKEFSKEITNTLKTKDIAPLKKFLSIYKDHLSLFQIVKEIEFVCSLFSFQNSFKKQEDYDPIVFENILNCLIDFAVENVGKENFLSPFSSYENVIDNINFNSLKNSLKKDGKILFYKGILKYLLQKYFFAQNFPTENQKLFIYTFIYQFFTDIFHFAFFTKDPFYNQLIQSKKLITFFYKKTKLYYALKDISSVRQFDRFLSFIQKHPNEKLYRTILDWISSIPQKDYDFIIIAFLINIGNTSLGISLLVDYFQKNKLFICDELYIKLYEHINYLKNREKFFTNKEKAKVNNYITLFEKLIVIDKEKEKRKLFDNNSLLHLAVMLDLKEIVLKLLQDGFDVNLKNSELNTPLFYVKSVEMVDILLKYGADTKIKNREGLTALEFMEKYKFNNPEIKQRLAQYIITPIVLKNIKKVKRKL